MQVFNFLKEASQVEATKGMAIFGVIALKGTTECDIDERICREVDIYLQSGVDGILVENRYGTYDNMRTALAYLKFFSERLKVGVHCLHFDDMGFSLAREFGADFVQIEPIMGQVSEKDLVMPKAFQDRERMDYVGEVIGRIAYGLDRHLEHLLCEAKQYCDGILLPANSIPKMKEQEMPLMAENVCPDDLETLFGKVCAVTLDTYGRQDHQPNGELVASQVREVITRRNQLLEH